MRGAARSRIAAPVVAAASGVWATSTAWPDHVVAGAMGSLLFCSSEQILRGGTAGLRHWADAGGGNGRAVGTHYGRRAVAVSFLVMKLFMVVAAPLRRRAGVALWWGPLSAPSWPPSPRAPASLCSP